MTYSLQTMVSNSSLVVYCVPMIPAPYFNTYERPVKVFGWVFFLISPAHLHVRPTPVGAYVQVGGRSRIEPPLGRN